MSGLNQGLVLGAGVLALAFHLISVALTRALRTYSRSRLEDVCAANGRPDRAAAIALWDEKTERSAEALAVLSGLALAALLGAIVARSAPWLAGQAVVLIALGLGAVGHVIAGLVGRVYAETVLDRSWPAAVWIRVLMMPLTYPARAAEAFVYHLSRRGLPLARPQSVEVELHTADLPVENVNAQLPETTRALVERAVELAHRDVAAIMTPRSSMLVLPATVSASEAARVFSDSGKSRVPLFGEHRDDIVGILYAKDLFPLLLNAADSASVVPRRLAREPMFVPESKNAAELLEEFRDKRIQIAMIVDEYGAVAGLVTLEDLIEELVGPIDDEHDIPTPTDPVYHITGSRYEVDATLPLEELNDRLHLHLPTDADYSTVGGLAFDSLGRLPEPGATFQREGVEFTVLDVAEHSIRRLRLDLQPAQAVGGS